MKVKNIFILLGWNSIYLKFVYQYNDGKEDLLRIVIISVSLKLKYENDRDFMK
jgi:hypothetical protein